MPLNSQEFKIERSVVFVKEDSSMAEAVELMVDKKISSVLVTDKDDLVVGILTERDVFRKFTLIDVSDKLTRTVGTVMGRGVKFVSPDSLLDDVVNLHFEFGMKHFPIARTESPRSSGIEGIVSVSDVLRHFLRKEAETLIEKKEIQLPIRVGLLCHHEKQLKKYQEDFADSPIELFPVGDMHDFVKTNGLSRFQLLIDLDGYKQKELGAIIQQVGAYNGNRILVMSHPSLVATFRQMIAKPDRQLKVCMKPLDVTYCSWLFTEKWIKT